MLAGDDVLPSEDRRLHRARLESEEGNITTHSMNASSPPQKHILFAEVEDENLSHPH